MAQRRPIASHPAFAPLVALWFAALFGLVPAVLPATLLERFLAAASLDALRPLTGAGRLAMSAIAGLVGGLLGLALARAIKRRAMRDPRPVFADSEPALAEPPGDAPMRRPLRVREELSAEFELEASGAGLGTGPAPAPGRDDADRPAFEVETGESFMILTPQPIHPPRPAPDLEALLVQFDEALAAFRADDDGRPAGGKQGPDPVHAFVARQTGSPAPPVASPLGGSMPDHQAELRAALEKLARAQRRDS